MKITFILTKLTFNLLSLAIVIGIILCILKGCSVLKVEWTLAFIPLYIACGLSLLLIVLSVISAIKKKG